MFKYLYLSLIKSKCKSHKKSEDLNVTVIIIFIHSIP